MINWLRIKNLALVEELTVDFDKGFNVITGETGSGKSVIMSAITLLLGERADKTSIRTGTKRCELSSVITIPENINEEVSLFLDERGVDFDNEECKITLRRVITANSSKNFINDTNVTLSSLKQLGHFLVDIHGANEHQSLIKNDKQLLLLDRYANIESEKKEYRNIYNDLKVLVLERQKMESNIPNVIEAEHLKFVISEIEDANLQEDEDKIINNKHKISANAKEISEIISQSNNILENTETSVSNQLSQLYSNLQSLSKIDSNGTDNILEQCSAIINLIQELTSDLNAYADGIDINEQEFNELEQRLFTIQSLKRRFGPNLPDVNKTLEDAKLRILQFSNSENIRNELKEKEEKLKKELCKKSEIISKQRISVSRKFAKAVSSELKELGFLQANFDVEFSKTEFTITGNDKIEYTFSANPGENNKPLKNVASSGEMSRIMLALKTILAESDTIPTLIFDEIDVNIGGKTAGIVGGKLKSLSKKRQILCISHLAQVAVESQSHFVVNKYVAKDATFTQIEKLSSNKQKTEIARMLGDNSAALKHAEDLLK